MSRLFQLVPLAFFGWIGFLRRSDQQSHDAGLDEPLALPPDFRFGAATAAHQVEGGLKNNWTRWESTTRADGGPTIQRGECSGDACDHWNRFEEDVLRMKALGLTMYRFSIEWSRIEPEENRFDEAALERYRAWCVQLRAAGITPMVTLHHFTEPLWIADRGGFEDPATVGAFARFAVPHLADVVDDWITINEPNTYAVLGWYYGAFPPGVRNPGRMARVLENLLLAHARAYHLIHTLDAACAGGDGVPCRVSLAANLVRFVPRSPWNPADALAARLLDRAYNLAPLHALATGRLRLYLPRQIDLDVVHPTLAGTWDFVGVNHYFRRFVAFDPGNPGFLDLRFDPDARKSDMVWDLTPGSLYDTLMRVGRYGLPVYVTENGVADGDEPDRRRRAWFLPRALRAVQEAVRDGVDVRAYVYWSLLDNFEWAYGFAPSFGLYRVDYPTQVRTLTTGGALYRNLIAAHRRRAGRG